MESQHVCLSLIINLLTKFGRKLCVCVLYLEWDCFNVYRGRFCVGRGTLCSGTMGANGT